MFGRSCTVRGRDQAADTYTDRTTTSVAMVRREMFQSLESKISVWVLVSTVCYRSSSRFVSVLMPGARFTKYLTIIL